MTAYGFGATLAMRPRRAARIVDLTADPPPREAVLTRASAAAFIAPNGLLSLAGGDVPRIDHDPVTLTPRGLLIEGAATNLVLQSDALDASPWTTSEAAVASNVAVAPTGAMAGDKLVESNATALHFARQTVGSGITAGAGFVLSAYAKAAERSSVQLRMIGTATFAQTNFNLATGTSSSTLAGSARIESAGAGWYRIQIAGIADATSIDCRIILFNGANSYAGDGSSGVLIHGVQLEAGAQATSPVATAATTASRAADVLTIDWRARGVPDGPVPVRYGFDDVTSQDGATTVSGGIATVPTTLQRARLRLIALV